MNNLLNNGKIEAVLEKMGFSPNEIKVYLALNDNGSSKAGSVAKIAHIDRSSCYNSLRSLLEKGIVSYVSIGEVKWFQATGPRALLDYIKEQEKEVEEIIPQLNLRHKASKIKGQVRLFKGFKGVRAIMQDIVRTAKPNFTFGNEGQLEERMPAYCKQFVRQLKEEKIVVRQIVRDGRMGQIKNRHTTRFVPKSLISPVVTNIYGDKIALIIWTDEPEGVIIENAAAAQSYRSYFEFMWQFAKE